MDDLNYVNGKLHGVAKYYNTFGKLRAIGNYENDLKRTFGDSLFNLVQNRQGTDMMFNQTGRIGSVVTKAQGAWRRTGDRKGDREGTRSPHQQTAASAPLLVKRRRCRRASKGLGQSPA